MNRGIFIGASFMALAVAMGAFGAHALGDSLDAYSREVYEKAAFYHFVHALGVLLVAILGASKIISSRNANRIVAIFTLGILFFSGSLYLLAVSGVKWLGAITPIGGTLFIVGWMLLAGAAMKKNVTEGEI